MKDQPENVGNQKRGPSMPRWVKVFGIGAIALLLLIAIIMFVSGGEHGPGRHMPSAEQGGQR